MALDCFATVKSCTSGAQNRVPLRIQYKPVMLLHARLLPNFVAVAVLGGQIQTPWGHEYLIVISDLFLKVARAIPLPCILAEIVAQTFVIHCIMEYSHPKWLLFDNEKQFLERFSQRVCLIGGVKNFFTFTCDPQTRSQVSRLRKRFFAIIRTHL